MAANNPNASFTVSWCPVGYCVTAPSSSFSYGLTRPATAKHVYCEWEPYSWWRLPVTANIASQFLLEVYAWIVFRMLTRLTVLGHLFHTLITNWRVGHFETRNCSCTKFTVAFWHAELQNYQYMEVHLRFRILDCNFAWAKQISHFHTTWKYFAQRSPWSMIQQRTNYSRIYNGV